MKPRTYFRLALLFPYILWGVFTLVAILLPSQEISPALDIVLMPVVFYVIGIFLWLIPYTLLAVGMWIWSRNRTTKALHKLALTAPILLLVLILIEAVILSLPAENIPELTKEMLNLAVVLGGFSLIFGYLCVGIAMGVFKLLQANTLIVEEMPIPD